MKKLLILLAIVLAAAAAFFYARQRRQPATAVAPAAAPSHPINRDDELALVHLACKGKVTVTNGKDGRTVGCSVCPPTSDFADEAGSSEPAWTQTSSVVTGNGISQGSFTAPHLHEAVMHIGGCESHATGLGGAFLFRFSNGAWQLIRYIKGAPTPDCNVLPFTNDRDAHLRNQRHAPGHRL